MVKMLLTVSGSWGENHGVWSEHETRKAAVMHAREQVWAAAKDGMGGTDDTTRGHAVLLTEDGMDEIKGIK